MDVDDDLINTESGPCVLSAIQGLKLCENSSIKPVP